VRTEQVAFACYIDPYPLAYAEVPDDQFLPLAFIGTGVTGISARDRDRKLEPVAACRVDRERQHRGRIPPARECDGARRVSQGIGEQAFEHCAWR